MIRKQFIESQGATCKNWGWSWSFINEKERVVIFGSLKHLTNGRTAIILSEDWQKTKKGRKSAGYTQSREHIRLIEEDGYRLMTFPAIFEHGEDGEPGRIVGFTPELTEKTLRKDGRNWCAVDSITADPLP